jgi:predicted dehydrogenase
VRRPIKVAVVGVGALGSHHARIHAGSPESDLVAVVDNRPDRARETAAAYGCKAITDYREVLGQVEAVSLAVPTELHGEIGSELLSHGIHVLVEKPMAASLQEADRLMQARKSGGAILQVGHSERFNPALAAVAGYVTNPGFFEAHRLGVFVPRSLDIDVVLDLMIHDLDLILRLVPSRVKEIKAVGIPVLTHRIDIANARLEFDNGCVANVTASRVSNEKVRKLRFFQPHDYVSVDFFKQEVEMYSLVESGAGKAIVQRQVEIVRGEPLRLEIEAFLRAVRGGEEGKGIPPCSPEEGKRVLSLALEILERLGPG